MLSLISLAPRSRSFLVLLAISTLMAGCASTGSGSGRSAKRSSTHASRSKGDDGAIVPEAEPSLAPEESLTAVVEQGLNGLTSLTVEQREAVLDRAKEWRPEAHARKHRLLPVRLTRSAFRSALRDGALNALESAPAGALRKLLSRFPKLDPLGKLSDKVLAAEECSNPNLAFVLAGEWENRFPDEKSINQAVSLYTRAMRCGKGETEIRSGYRLGLIQVWRGDYKDAIEAFDHVLNQTEDLDLHSRSFYWKAQCERRLGLPNAGVQERAQLLGMFPFSYHVLLMHWPHMEVFQSWCARRDSRVQMRSKLVPELNPSLELIEAWADLKKREKIYALIPSLQPELQKAEPEVRLYYTALLERAGLYVPKFKELAVLIKNYPEIRSRAALQLLYPSPTLIRYPDDSDQRLVESLIRQESAFDPRARSRVGAMGLMQLMPRTAKLVSGVRPRQLWDASTNVKVGSRYLQKLIDRFNGDVELALAAYNAGPEKVDAWVQRYPVENRILFLDLIPFKETREYVASIARNFVWYSVIYGHDQNQARALATGTEDATQAPAVPLIVPPAPEEIFRSLRSVQDHSQQMVRQEQGRLTELWTKLLARFGSS